jgi:hypothetical protein
MATLLSSRLEAEVEVRDIHLHQGRERIECTLSSEDGQTLYLYEGQLKDLGKKPITFQKGKRYKLTFAPYVNNRWIEIKLVGVAPA